MLFFSQQILETSFDNLFDYQIIVHKFKSITLNFRNVYFRTLLILFYG